MRQRVAGRGNDKRQVSQDAVASVRSMREVKSSHWHLFKEPNVRNITIIPPRPRKPWQFTPRPAAADHSSKSRLCIQKPSLLLAIEAPSADTPATCVPKVEVPLHTHVFIYKQVRVLTPLPIPSHQTSHFQSESSPVLTI